MAKSVSEGNPKFAPSILNDLFIWRVLPGGSCPWVRCPMTAGAASHYRRGTSRQRGRSVECIRPNIPKRYCTLSARYDGISHFHRLDTYLSSSGSLRSLVEARQVVTQASTLPVQQLIVGCSNNPTNSEFQPAFSRTRSYSYG